jgi:hypothetical protein
VGTHSAAVFVHPSGQGFFQPQRAQSSQREDKDKGAALRMRYLLNQPRLVETMGARAQTFVRENFLLTRQLREYLTLGLALLRGQGDRIELG